MLSLHDLAAGGHRRLRRLLGRDASDGYWEGRKNFRYYQEVIRMARTYAARANSVLDVGPHQTPFVAQLNWIKKKTAIDLEQMPRIRGVDCIQGDFLQFESTEPFDLVLCMQVLEHLDDPARFANKLLQTGRTLIISVPYCWPEGFCEWHVQDPVDEAKVRKWIGRDWLEHSISEDADGLRRLVAVYDAG
jgi:SAM-dependent methyltransferase